MNIDQRIESIEKSLNELKTNPMVSLNQEFEKSWNWLYTSECNDFNFKKHCYTLATNQKETSNDPLNQ